MLAPPIAVAPERRPRAARRRRAASSPARYRARNAPERIRALGDLRAGGIEEQHHRRASRCAAASSSAPRRVGLHGADRAAREPVLDQRDVDRGVRRGCRARGSRLPDARRRAARTERQQAAPRARPARRAHRAAATTTSGCSAVAPAPCAIWWRQLVPAATMVAPAAARTAGSSASLGHLHRDVVVLVAERARHAAAARLDRLDLGAREWRAAAPASHRRCRRPSGGSGRARGSRCGCAPAPRQRDRCRARARRRGIRRRASPRPRAAWRAASPGKQRRVLVAEGEQARRLEPEDRHAALEVRAQRGERAARLGARLVHHAGWRDRCGRSTAGAPSAAARDDDAMAGGLEHARGGREVSGLDASC